MDQRNTVSSLRTDGMTGLKVVNALRNAGLEPFDQLIGYVLTGNKLCITRQESARTIISKMEPSEIKEYIVRSGKWPEVYA